MTRQLITATLIAVLALQALLMAPAAGASGAGSHSPAMDCAEHMADGQQDCPCCPDEVATMAGCMTLCTGLAVTLALPIVDIRPPHAAVIPFLAPPLPVLSYTPPNPPPIG